MGINMKNALSYYARCAINSGSEYLWWTFLKKDRATRNAMESLLKEGLIEISGSVRDMARITKKGFAVAKKHLLY